MRISRFGLPSAPPGYITQHYASQASSKTWVVMAAIQERIGSNSGWLFLFKKIFPKTTFDRRRVCLYAVSTFQQQSSVRYKAETPLASRRGLRSSGASGLAC